MPMRYAENLGYKMVTLDLKKISDFFYILIKIKIVGTG